MDLSNTNSLSFKPFIFNKYLKNSSLSWNTGIKLIRTEFIGSVEKPEWEYKKPEWDEDSITNHTLNFNFMAEEGNFFQKLILTTNLPPRVDSYTGSIELGYKNISISGGTGIKQKSAEDETWVKNPFEQKFSASFFDNKLRLTETYSYNLEEKEKTKFSCSITGYNLTLSYLMQNISGYTYSKTTGWKTTNEKEFQPVSLKLGYSTASKLNFSFLDDKIKFSPNFSTELNYDILRPTNSYFTFRPSITLKINNFLDLTFSSDSRNSVIYRYIQNYTDFEPKIPGETNIFKDLINSFAFGNTALRESSGFKLKSLNIALAHELHDWKLTAEFEIEPRIITEDKKQKYDFSPYFSLSVLWKPMDSIKTTIEDEYGTFYLNP